MAMATWPRARHAITVDMDLLLKLGDINSPESGAKPNSRGMPIIN
jgi:hypothetical protein